MAQKRYAIVIVEGETEKALFMDFKAILNYPIKRIVKVNLWNNKINTLMPSLTEPSDILVVYDTDVKINIERFKENIKILKAKKHNVFLLQQSDDFECELSYASSIGKRALFEEFCPKIVSSDNFKSEFIRASNRVKRLNDLGLNKDKLWERDLIKELFGYIAMHSSHEKYFS